ncbi:hypothetical protein K3495_g11592, partial [Podosphaera aphanis]
MEKHNTQFGINPSNGMNNYLFPNVNANDVMDTALLSELNKPANWKIDSGATKHFSGSFEDFSSLKRWASPKYVSTADGNKWPADGYGTCQIGNFTLKEVYIAIAKKKWKVIFKAPLTDGLFQLTVDAVALNIISQNLPPAHHSEITTIPKPTDEMSRIPSTDSELWHFRLAHASYKTISRLPNISSKPKAISKGEDVCEACLAGKMKESFSKKTDNRTFQPARRLHADISGRLPTSIRGYNYFLIVIDDASRCGWIRLLKTKSTAECLPSIKEIVAHSDNGSGEFGQQWKEWCKELGIETQPSPPYKHSLNGVAERANGYLVQLAKSMIFHAQLDWKFYWCYAIQHAMYIRNRLPTTALPFGPENTRPGSNSTPISAFSDKNTNLDKLRIFGCAAFPLRLKETKIAPSKFSPNIQTEWIFIGIHSNTIWILLNRKTGAEQLSVDCKFKEHIFLGILIQEANDNTPSGILNKIFLPATASGGVERKCPRPSESAQGPSESTQGRVKVLKTGRKCPRPSESAQGPSESTQGPSESTQDRAKVLKTGRKYPRPSESTQRPSESAQESSKNAINKNLQGYQQSHITSPDIKYKDGNADQNADLQIVTRSGKAVGINHNKSTKGFGNNVSLMVKALNALHIQNREESTSVGVPAIPFESLTIEQAIFEDKIKWEASLLDELKSLEENNTFEIIEGDYSSTNGRKLISPRWVLRNKLYTDGSIARRKARIVGKGYEQQHGIDYFETFASVIRFATLRAM